MKTKTPTLAFAKAGLIIALFFIFFGCQKNLDDKPAVQATSSTDVITVFPKDDASVAIDWYNLQLRMILNANPSISTLAANRLFGYSGISLYEAARFEIRNSISLQRQLNQMPVMPVPDNAQTYSWVASANAAMANITRDVFPLLTTANHASIDSLEKAYNDKLTAEVGAAVVARSQAFGDSVASAIFNWAKSDLFDHVNDPYIIKVFPGAWVPTPPLFSAPAGPYMGNCRPFLQMHSHGTTLPPPYSYSTVKGSDYFKMVNRVYNISQTLTDDQKNIALYWNDVGVNIGYTPMGHNISIITQILQNSGASLATAEEAYLKAGIALWDATIVCWRSKYKYSQLRPVTYIQQNINSTWLPLLTTPNHPEYPAAHAFITSSVMEVLGSVFGRGYDFTDHTYDFRGFSPRSYSSFEQAAIECGESRVYGGIHFQPSVDVGHLYGQLIGKDVELIRLTK
ncbi:MAG TPA: vanadium-dependent haloperoxidase [Panacibacter sp.]|nr:vanadium-dependent haloperoxidase [Panacibacter sp.]HNP44485.1 vanadium-dependent haloperoxidase [Panacibacter sp.]